MYFLDTETITTRLDRFIGLKRQEGVKRVMPNKGNMIPEHETMRAKPVGRCIYCGSTNDLTDEHIIPYALGGRYILPKSSCQKCNKITSLFERSVLRGFMMNARLAVGLPTRRPKARPNKIEIKGKRDDNWENVELSTGEYPAMLHLPLLDPPGIIMNSAPGTGITVYCIETVWFGKNLINAVLDKGLSTIRFVENWDITSFARMLAKIGYSYIVAQKGLLPLNEVPVLPLILGEADDASFWLGSLDYRLNIEENKPFHALGGRTTIDPTDASKILTIARVKLFASSGATGYEIVVHRC